MSKKEGIRRSVAHVHAVARDILILDVATNWATTQLIYGALQEP